MRFFLFVCLLTMHLSLFSKESSVYYVQDRLSDELKTAEKLIEEKHYDLAIRMLEGIRVEATSSEKNSYMATIYSNSTKIENSIYMSRKEYLKSARFLIDCIHGFYANLVGYDTQFYGRILLDVQELEKVERYSAALEVYEVLKDKPLKFDLFKHDVEQKIAYLNNKIGRQANLTADVTSVRNRDIIKSSGTTSKKGNTFQYEDDDSDTGIDMSAILGEATKQMTSMFGLEEGSDLEDLKGLNLSDMNIDFDALESMAKEKGLDFDAEVSMDSLKYMFNLAKSNDSLLYTKIKNSSERSIASNKKNGKTENTSYLMETFNLYGANLRLGNYENAEMNLVEFERVYNKLPLNERGGYSEETAVISFWSLYMVQKKYDKAVEYALERLEGNKDSKRNADITYNIAFTYFGAKDYTNAQKWCEQTIASIKAQNNNRNKSTLRNTETIYYMSLLANGSYAAALKGLEPRYLNNKNTTSEKEGSSWELFISPVSAMAIASMNTGQHEKADRYMTEYIENANAQIFASVLDMNTGMALDDEGDKYVSDNIFYFLSQRKDKTGNVVASGYNTALIFKELLLNKDRTIAENYLKTEDEELKALFIKYLDVKEKSKDLNRNKASQDSLADYDRAYEKILKQKGAENIVGLFDTSKFNFSDVQRQLNTNEVALEFITYSPYHFMKNSDTVFYGVFVLKKDSKYPEFIPLCKEADLKPLVEPINLDIKALELSRLIYSNNANTIYNLVWKPIENSLNGASKVYYAPTGILHNLSFDALSNDEKSFLAESHSLVRVGSTKNIMNKNQTPQKYKKAALFGSIDYETMEVATSRGSNGRSSQFNFLSGTVKEVSEIKEILKNDGIEIEERLKKMPRRRISIPSLKKCALTYFMSLPMPFI